ncbi:hypothetical protein [Bradyrhizobium elkanii]|uniref:hypothetical protein n=1 Tax=Bradyrhizobium elkanii TaxID=29448 RepID=UPI0004B42C71|nr:hypothetical protein [Bradyrhizobium elkanii]WLA79618.1 hypothetical protein QNJ99_30005 [Bradyrhizobium elkanii]
MKIVKVQLALATNDPARLALVYAKGRVDLVQQKLDLATTKAMGDDPKAFFEAEYRPSIGTWSIGKRVKDQKW